MVGQTQMEAVGLVRSGQLLAEQVFGCYFQRRIRDGSVLLHSNPLHPAPLQHVFLWLVGFQYSLQMWTEQSLLAHPGIKPMTLISLTSALINLAKCGSWNCREPCTIPHPSHRVSYSQCTVCQPHIKSLKFLCFCCWNSIKCLSSGFSKKSKVYREIYQ